MKVNHGNSGEVYKQVSLTEDFTYYQKVGSSREILFSKPETDLYILENYFKANELSIPLLHITDTVVSSSSNWNLKEGDTFYGYPAYNFDRTQRKTYRFISKSVDGNIVRYRVEEVLGEVKPQTKEDKEIAKRSEC